MAKRQFAPHFNSFAELMEMQVLPLRQTHPEYEQLDGLSGSNGSAFAYFDHFSKKWRVNKDTKIDRLLAAWKLYQTGAEPFVIGKTIRSKKPCLQLNEENPEPKGLFIYL